MTLQTRAVDYSHDGVALEGELVWDDAWTEPRPGVLVVHDAMKSAAGFERGRAEALARLGYAGFVIDVYGKGVQGETNEDAYALMAPFQEDRNFLLQRLLASVSAAGEQPEIDASALAAIGYCFGGLCVLDLARGHAPLRGVASFHGLLTPPRPEPGAAIDTRVLVLHGWDDPFVPEEQVAPFAREMTSAGADWQLHAFGNTLHSFSNPSATDAAAGTAYDAAADRRSWQLLTSFLAELFE